MYLLCQAANKGIGAGICYNAAYVSQTQDQKHFTISELAADWHELMLLQSITLPLIARTNEQLDAAVQYADTPPPATLGLHPQSISYYSLPVPLK